MFISSLLTAYCLLLTAPAFTWGFFAHKKINQLAVFTLPPEMISFYKTHIDYLTVHAVDPDRRRYSNPDEAPRHYLDADHYGKHPFDSLPHHWKDAVKKFSEDTLNAYGIVPWYIETMMYRLTQAFKDGNVDRILYLSANIGHYIEDAHVPLHTTENYNGQLTNQVGIHGFWESRIPELFADNWDLFTGRAEYVDKINERIWKIVKASYAEKDSVLEFEAALTQKFSPDKKYSYEKKGNGTVKVYSEDFSRAYNDMLDGMVERRMRASIFDVGSFWYTAWMNAGSPDLNKLASKEVSDSLKQAEKENEELWKTGKPVKGHDE
ncbi:MAG: S1/P1 Nuclease [Bacteroidetes bacterium]|nr:S1/P1 Nuclease [Bacteroidota bacterium]